MAIRIQTDVLLRGVATLAAFALGCGCTPQPDQRPDAARVADEQQELKKWRHYWTTPVYREEHPILGKLLFGHHDTTIALCAAPRDRCTQPYNVDGSEQLCLVDLTDRANAQQEEFFRGKTLDETIGEYWLEGKGRIAIFPGSFGGGSYTCQVLVTDVRVLDSGRPWFWTPPPGPRANEHAPDRRES